jgi:hypothetical protein
MVVAIMPKKKTSDDVAPRRSLKTGPREGRPGERRPTAMNMKGREEWVAWLKRFAAKERVASTMLVDIAVTAYAKARGFEEPPPR